MSLDDVNDILQRADPKRVIGELTQLVAERDDARRDPAVWGKTMQYLVSHVLAKVPPGTKDARKQYSEPLRALLGALHASTPPRPSLSHSGVVALFKYWQGVFRDTKCAAMLPDYAAAIQSLLRLPKYASWVPLPCITDITGAIASSGNENLMPCYAALLGAKTLPVDVAISALDFAEHYLEHGQRGVLGVLRSVNAVLRQRAVDMVHRAKQCADTLGKVALRWWDLPSSNDAIRYELIDFFRIQVRLHWDGGERMPHCDELWSALQRTLDSAILLKGLTKWDAEDHRALSFIDLASHTAAYVTRFTEWDGEAKKRRRRATPIDSTLAALSPIARSAKADDVQVLWLRVVCAMFQLPRFHPTRHDMAMLLQGLSSASVSDAVLPLLLRTAAWVLWRGGEPDTSFLDTVVARIMSGVGGAVRAECFHVIAASLRTLPFPNQLAGFYAAPPPSDPSEHMLQVLGHMGSPGHLSWVVTAVGGTGWSGPFFIECAVRTVRGILSGDKVSPVPPPPAVLSDLESIESFVGDDESGALGSTHTPKGAAPGVSATAHASLVAALSSAAKEIREVQGCVGLFALVVLLGVPGLHTLAVDLLGRMAGDGVRAPLVSLLPKVAPLLVSPALASPSTKGGVEYFTALSTLSRRLVHLAEQSMDRFVQDLHPATIFNPGGDAEEVRECCRCAAFVVHEVSRVAPQHAEPLPANDLLPLAERKWDAVRNTGAAMYLLELLGSCRDTRCLQVATEKAREVLGSKQNVYDNTTYQGVLEVMHRVVEGCDEGVDDTLSILLRDTVEKLSQVHEHMEPATKVAFVRLAISLVRKGDGDMLNTVIANFLPFLTDSSFVVRRTAALEVPALVALFGKPIAVFHSIIETLSPHFASPFDGRRSVDTRAQTSVFAVVEIARRSSVVQGCALLQLLVIYVHPDFSEKVYLTRQLHRVALAAGAKDTEQLLDWHADVLLHGWVVGKRKPLRGFPHHLMGCSTYEDLLDRYMHILLPAAIQSGERDDLVARLAEQAGRDETELTVAHLAPCFATSYVLYYTDHKDVAKAVCEGFIKLRISEQRLAVQLEKATDEVLRVFMSLEVASEDEAVPPQQPSTVITHALRDFALLWGHPRENAVQGLLASTPDRAFRILLAGGLEVLDTNRVLERRKHKLQVFLNWCTRCAERTILAPATLRLVLITLLKAARDVSAELALPELQRVALLALTRHPANLAPLLPHTVSALLALCSPLPGAVPTPTNAPVLSCSMSLFDDASREQVTTPDTPKPPALDVLETILSSAAESRECRQALSESVNPVPPHYSTANGYYNTLVGLRGTSLGAYAKYIASEGLSGVVLDKLEQHLLAPSATVDGQDAQSLAEELARVSTGGTTPDAALCGVRGLLALRRHSIEASFGDDIPPLQLPDSNEWTVSDFIASAKVRLLGALVEAVNSACPMVMDVASHTLWSLDIPKKLCPPPLLEALAPFLRGHTTGSHNIDTLETAAVKLESEAMKCAEGAWDPKTVGYSTREWVCPAVASIARGAKDPFLAKCTAAALVDPSVAKLLLPAVVVADVATKETDRRQLAIARLFTRVLQATEQGWEGARLVLNAVLTVQAIMREDTRRSGVGEPSAMRLPVQPGSPPPLIANIDMLSCARAAVCCGAPATGSLFLQHALERTQLAGLVYIHSPWPCTQEPTTEMVLDMLDDVFAPRKRKGDAKGGDDRAPGLFPTRGVHDKQRLLADDPLLRKLLGTIAGHTNDLDLLAAAGTELLVRYEQRGEWLRALVAADGGGAEADEHLGRCLRGCGLLGVASRVRGSGCLDEARKEAAWMLSTAFDEEGNSERPSFNESLQQALAHLRTGDRLQFQSAMQSAAHHVAGLVQGGRHQLPVGMAHATCCAMLDTAWDFLWDARGSRKPPPENTVLRSTPLAPFLGGAKRADDVAMRSPVEGLEIAAPHLLRPLLLCAVGRDDLHLPSTLYAVRTLLSAGFQDRALGVLHRSPPHPEIARQKAKVLWTQGDHEGAISAMHDLAAGNAPASLRTLGKWLGGTQAETGAHIIARYLTPALREATGVHEKAKAFFSLARYTDRLYVTLLHKGEMRGSRVAASILADTRGKLTECQRFLKDNKGALPRQREKAVQRHAQQLTTFLNKAMADEDQVEYDRGVYLLLAVKSYASTLQHTDKYDTITSFRLVALWLQNPQHSDLAHFLTGFFGKLSCSRKFAPLAYQLVSRLQLGKSTADPFQATLEVLLQRLARDHPHHVLYHISALSRGCDVPPDQRLREVYTVDVSRVKAAKALLKAIAKSSKVAPIIEEMGRLVDAYVELAFMPCSKELDGKRQRLPDTLAIASIRDMNNTVVTSHALPVSSSYASAPRVKEFEAYFTTAGGVNMPKIIRCLGSDGVWYKQLVKGKDDLRQDAVLEQIFGLCNTLLPDPTALRTYKVVPLTPTSGVVQWVDNTMPMGEWLIGRSTGGAHLRYHPSEIHTAEARRRLMEAGPESKLAVFTAICNDFTPVMHHFFLERYPSPLDWLRARERYTVSTAVASIVGYIIGLGDRHSQNILIDSSTGEIVHIDLGIAFERGKLLPVPEVVPFRLTRDVIDGFGITGVEGKYRRCCERTMKVLRAKKELLQTVVEVFVYDPLYNYSLDPSRILAKQREFALPEVPRESNTNSPVDEKRNADAELALLRVTEKLEGFDEGEFLSVEGHCRKLIKHASSLENLAVMYPGWAPWV